MIAGVPISSPLTVFRHLAKCLNSVLNVIALVGSFNQKKAISVIVKTDCETNGSSAALNIITFG